MGAYGTGDEASKTYFGEPACETILAGDINGDCVVDFDDLAIVVSQWMMSGEDFINKPPIVRILEPKEGDQVAWPGPTIFRIEAIDPDGVVDNVSASVNYSTENYGTSRGIGLSDQENGQWQGEYTWRGDITNGTWTVRAEATDNGGARITAPEIVVHLYRP